MRRVQKVGVWLGAVVVSMGVVVATLGAQARGAAPTAPPPQQGRGTPVAPAPAGVKAPEVQGAPVTPPADYIIGPDDILSIIFWRDKDMSQDVVVRPDGKISLPVLNEIQASGLTPEQLRGAILTAATKYFESPTVNVVVKQINSRRVFVMGEVAKPGPYALSGKITVLQIISMAGGLNEYAKSDKIRIIRNENNQPKSYKVNYKEILEGKNLKQNIELMVGDTIVVP